LLAIRHLAPFQDIAALDAGSARGRVGGEIDRDDANQQQRTGEGTEHFHSHFHFQSSFTIEMR
jgi:hypothetical protein